jgi:hypothetical protein
MIMMNIEQQRKDNNKLVDMLRQYNEDKIGDNLKLLYRYCDGTSSKSTKVHQIPQKIPRSQVTKS